MKKDCKIKPVAGTLPLGNQVAITFDLGDDTPLQEEPAEEHHPLFCEMAELRTNRKHGLEPEWREAARWVKFEEDVEEGGQRWSKPYVASLPLHSLMELRSTLSTGSMILDLSASSLTDVWTAVVQGWISDNSIQAELREPLFAALFQRYRHLLQRRPKTVKDSDPVGNSRRNSLSTFLKTSSANLDRIDSGIGHTNTGVTFQQVMSVANFESIQGEESKPNMHLFKKLPPGTEAANIMVAELDFLPKPLYMFVRLSKAVMLGNLTEVPVPTRFLYVLLGPKTTARRYYQIGRTMGTLFSDELFQRAVYKATVRRDILNSVDEFLGAATVLPPGEWDPNIRIEPPAHVQTNEARRKDKIQREMSFDDLIDIVNDEPNATHVARIMRTGRLFGGLVQDVKGKLPFYASDFRDALSSQCVASFIFLYFASMTPLITFGGLMSDLLKMRMGAVETIFARALSGVIWGFTCGQPMVILGCTGPILVYELIIFNLCENFGIEYMSFRVWIGLWSMVQMLLMVAFDLSSLVSYITRFTEESFAALVSAIFVYEAIKKLLHIAVEEPVMFHPDQSVTFCQLIPHNQTLANESLDVLANSTTDALTADCIVPKFVPDAFFLSVILFFGTYFLTAFLRDFKNSSFFPARIRQFISDFAVIITIAVFVGVDFSMGIPTPKLSVPEKLEPTYSAREGSWIVPFFGGNPWWTALVAFIPGLLATILIFMDQQITSVIVNRKENRLQKGHGYHLDLLVVAFLTAVLSILGMPWMIADTVLSLTHVSSLKMESTVAAPGERPTFLGVREQRVTNILIATTIGVSIFMTAVLMVIPMPVLFGVFLFMGINALNGLQFTDRIKLFFMPLKHQPDYSYLRHIKIARIHLFTIIQLGSFIILWVLKSFQQTALLFPLMVGTLVGVRKLLDFIFSQHELGFLDDIMPEHVKRKKEDTERRHSMIYNDYNNKDSSTSVDDGCLRIKLPNGNYLTIPGEKLEASSDALDFTDAINNTNVWKNVSSSDLLADRIMTAHHNHFLRVPNRTRINKWDHSDVNWPDQKHNLSPVPDGSDEELIELHANKHPPVNAKSGANKDTKQ